MRTMYLVAAIVLTGFSVAHGQEGRSLPPIVVGQVERIGGNQYLQSPELILAAVGDKLAAARWPKYTQLPSNDLSTGLHINYSFVVVEQTQQSGNYWNANPLQYFPELSRFAVSYSQSANDVRSRYLCGIELWGIFDSNANGGRIEIARGRGGSAGAFDYLPYQGGSSYVSVSGGSHNSYHSGYTTNPMAIKEHAMLKEAVDRMFTDLAANLTQRGYMFCGLPNLPPKVDHSPMSAPLGQTIGGPPQFGSRLATSSWLYRKLLTAGEISHYKRCKRVIIWEKQAGSWQKLETVASGRIKFTSKLVELQRTTSEQPTEYLQFEL